jgi:hypothetical protein
MPERNTIRRIRDAVKKGELSQAFRGADVNRVLAIDWGGNFLAKHCVGNGYTTELFVRVGRGLYRLRQ